MGGGGSKKKAPEGVSQHDVAVLDLKTQRDKLKQARKRAELAIEKETEAAAELARRGQRDRALLCLKKKRYQMTLMSQIEGALDNVQSLVDSIEFAQLTAQVVDRLKVGKDALEELNRQVTVEDVERIMDDTADAIAYRQEIAQLLGTKLSDEDTDAAEEELAALLAADAQTAAVKAPTTTTKTEELIAKIPEVPQGGQVEVEEEEEAEEARPARVLVAN